MHQLATRHASLPDIPILSIEDTPSKQDIRHTKMDLQELHSQIRIASKQAFSLVRSLYPNEKFCGYALYSDADAITVCLSANTRSHLESMIAKDPGDAEYYRWSPAEWNHEFEGAEYFDQVSKALYEEVKGVKSIEEHSRLKNDVYECCVAVLEELKIDGFFNDLDETGVLVFSISDSSNDLESSWIERLNRPEMAARFRMWKGTLSN